MPSRRGGRLERDLEPDDRKLGLDRHVAPGRWARSARSRWPGSRAPTTSTSTRCRTSTGHRRDRCTRRSTPSTSTAHIAIDKIPDVRAHLPANFSVALSMLGMELLCVRLFGEAQMITEPYRPNPCEVCGGSPAQHPDRRSPSRGRAGGRGRGRWRSAARAKAVALQFRGRPRSSRHSRRCRWRRFSSARRRWTSGAGRRSALRARRPRGPGPDAGAAHGAGHDASGELHRLRAVRAGAASGHGRRAATDEPPRHAAVPQAARRGRRGLDVTLTLVNAGNVDFGLARAHAFNLLQLDAVEDAIHAVLRQEPPAGERRLDRFGDELAARHGGLVRVAIREGAGTIPPGGRAPGARSPAPAGRAGCRGLLHEAHGEWGISTSRWR